MDWVGWGWELGGLGWGRGGCDDGGMWSYPSG